MIGIQGFDTSKSSEAFYHILFDPPFSRSTADSPPSMPECLATGRGQKRRAHVEQRRSKLGRVWLALGTVEDSKCAPAAVSIINLRCKSWEACENPRPKGRVLPRGQGCL